MTRFPILGVLRHYDNRQKSDQFGFLVYPIETQCFEHKIPVEVFYQGVMSWSESGFVEDYIFVYEKVDPQDGYTVPHKRGLRFFNWTLRGVKICVCGRVRTWGKGWRVDKGDHVGGMMEFLIVGVADLAPLKHVPYSPKTVHIGSAKGFLNDSLKEKLE